MRRSPCICSPSELGCEVTEDEQGYLAMHYAVASDHLKKPQNISVAVVCSSGLGTSRLLKHKVTEQFGLSEKQIVMLSLAQLSAADLHGGPGTLFPAGQPIL